jgi:hypothetical protein
MPIWPGCAGFHGSDDGSHGFCGLMPVDCSRDRGIAQSGRKASVREKSPFAAPYLKSRTAGACVGQKKIEKVEHRIARRRRQAERIEQSCESELARRPAALPIVAFPGIGTRERGGPFHPSSSSEPTRYSPGHIPSRNSRPNARHCGVVVEALTMERNQRSTIAVLARSSRD